MHPSPWKPSIHRTCPISAVTMRKARLPIGAQEGAIVQNFTTGRHDCYQPGERSAIITINTKTIIHRTYRLGMSTVRKVRLSSAKKKKGKAQPPTSEKGPVEGALVIMDTWQDLSCLPYKCYRDGESAAPSRGTGRHNCRDRARGRCSHHIPVASIHTLSLSSIAVLVCN